MTDVLRDEDFPTEQATDIFTRLIPEWSEKFLEANRQYKDVGNALGSKGVFPDVWRKVNVLRSTVWEGEPAGRESPREIMFDLIGHLFLMVHMCDEENAEAMRAAGSF